MKRAPHIHLVYGRPPADFTGSQVVLRRHLQRFERDGWRVSFSTYEHKLTPADDLPASWVSYPLPFRRWWWPPYRARIPGMDALRQRLFSVDLATRLAGDRPDVILTVLEPYEAQIAADVARLLRRPLAVIMHDQPELFEDVAAVSAVQRSVRRAAERVLRRADRVYPVTPELAAAYGPGVVDKSHTLLPLPAGGTPAQSLPPVWRDAHARPHVVHVGSLHFFQVPNMWAVAEALKVVGGRLTLSSFSTLEWFEDLARAHPHVTLRGPFPTSDDMLAYCSREATALLISYAFDAQPWSATSFPSRLVELSHLGLPVEVLAPPQAAASKWARGVGWTAHVESLDKAALTAELEALSSRIGWEKRSFESRIAASSVFAPNEVHRGFAADLLKMVQ